MKIQNRLAKPIGFFLCAMGIVCGSCTLVAAQENAAAEKLAIEKLRDPGTLAITVGENQFAFLNIADYAKPIVFPIYGPDQIPMTRNHPMYPGTPGEAADHKHHKSMWFGHGDINGVSFWHEEGRIVHDRIEKIDNAPESPSITMKSKLIGPDGKLIATETEKLTFRATKNARMIDWDVTIHASEGELKFGDTKEGMMAIRTHPNLRLDGDVATGSAVNSEGGSGGSIWGKSAKWVDYHGSIDGKTVGIAIFDHPQNLRHPTRWHARTYGLVAANPFGLSHFVDKSQDGSHIVPQGESLRFRYRFVFHKGTTEEAAISKLYEQFAKTDLVAAE
ncbi:PmoA family protein [Planctomycetota bacterium]